MVQQSEPAKCQGEKRQREREERNRRLFITRQHQGLSSLSCKAAARRSLPKIPGEPGALAEQSIFAPGSGAGGRLGSGTRPCCRCHGTAAGSLCTGGARPGPSSAMPRASTVLLLLAGLCCSSRGQYNEEEDVAWLQYYLRQSRASSYNYAPYYEEESPAYSYSYPSASDSEPEPEPQQAVPWRCPQECDCPPNFSSAMYCDTRNLRYLPFVPSRMKYVYFQNNLVTAIQEGAFDNATELEWLALHNNQIGSEKVGRRVFGKLRRLERLYMNNNNLTRLPSPLPRSLRELHLSHNHISKVPPSALEGLENLTALYLSHNFIFEMGASLKGLSSLILADLSYNNLRRVPDGLPASLEQLYLEYNYINAIPGDYFQVSPRLLYVRMSHNSLTNQGLSSNTFNSSSILELDLSYNRLQKIPRVNTNLENLYLQGNQINEFSISSFCSVVDVMNYSRLQVLRLDGNAIKRNAVPPDAPLCLRRATVIEI